MKLLVLFRFVLLAALLGLASKLWMGERTSQLYDSQGALLAQRMQTIDELRLVQSEFDALQTLVAAYVVSKNSQHLVNYFELLDTHAGERTYAKPVDNVYWSRMIAGTIDPVALAPGQGPTLQARLQLPEALAPAFTANLRSSDNTILRLSAILREREQIIFALTQGLYDPEKQQFVSEAPEREDIAIQMLFSEAHLSLNNAIRAEIQSRIGLVENAYQDALVAQTQSIQTTASIDLYTGLLITASLLIGLGILHFFVIRPLRELDELSQQIATGHYDSRANTSTFITEIKNLGVGFNLMVGAFRRELEQAEATRSAERAAMEAKLGRERAEAQAEARSMLLANMSHEIRTPMNAILGMTDLALKSDLPEKERGYLQKAQNAARSLLGLLNDILDFSRAEAGMVQFETIPFTLDEVLSNAFLAVQTQAANRRLMLLNNIRDGYSTTLGQRLVGDPLRIRQVLTNLLSNAVKFTEQGTVTVNSQLTTMTDNMLELRIEVIDTGIGLSQSQLSRIFKKFSQGESSISRIYGGTGLGLSIAQELVALMGGQIGVDSQPGQGSCFWFTLPIGYDHDTLMLTPPCAGQRCLLMHKPGGSGQALMGTLQATGLEVHPETCVDALVPRLQTNAYNMLVVEPAVFETQLWPEVANAIIQNQSIFLIAIHDNLFAADTHWLRQLPQSISQQLLHLAHPLVSKDLLHNLEQHNAMPQPVALEPTAFAAKQTTQQPAQSPAKLESLQGLRVLVLEDHPVNQELIETMLQGFGMTVHVCDNGLEGQTLLDDPECPEFDLFITDIEMPHVDGYEFTVWLRDQTRWLDKPVVGLTGHAFAETRSKCMDAGMDEFLTKPIDAQTLYDCLCNATGKHASNKSANAQNTLGEARVRQLFTTHCADLPMKLRAALRRGDEASFRREVHSMVSLLALLDETKIQADFKHFEAGLAQGSLQATEVLDLIQQQWFSLVKKYHQPQAEPGNTQGG